MNPPTVVPSQMDSLMGWLMLPKAHPTGDDTPTLPVFTVDFNPAKGPRSQTVEIGKIDRSKAAGDLGHAPVSNRTTAKWTVDNISWSVNGQAITTAVNGHATNYTQSMLFGAYRAIKRTSNADKLLQILGDQGSLMWIWQSPAGTTRTSPTTKKCDPRQKPPSYLYADLIRYSIPTAHSPTHAPPRSQISLYPLATAQRPIPGKC